MEQLEIRNLIKDHLETGKIGDIYRNTYYSLLDRVLEDGCFPESVGDGGNGEQCAWWCWAIAKLRKELGLDAAPKKVVIQRM